MSKNCFDVYVVTSTSDTAPDRYANLIALRCGHADRKRGTDGMRRNPAAVFVTTASRPGDPY